MRVPSLWVWRKGSSVPSGLMVAVVQFSLLMLIGFSFWVDRITRPRAWVATEPVDPDLPIRGRYVSLRLVVPVQVATEDSVPLLEPRASTGSSGIAVQLKVDGDRLVASEETGGAPHPGWQRRDTGAAEVTLEEPLAFFIPPGVEDPSIRAADDPLWVEVTLPRSGLPRPIRLGEERQGRIVPLELR